MSAWRAWFQVLRIGGLPTVYGNLFASCLAVIYVDSLDPLLLAKTVWHQGPRMLWVPLVSTLLYLTGMLWNDLVDVGRDRVLHPLRPLPSGRLPLGAAWLMGVLLPVATLLGSVQLGERGLFAAGAVLSLILLYDAGAKEVPWLGSLVMGLVRGAHAIFALLALGPDIFDRVVIGTASLFGMDPAHLGLAGTVPAYPLLLTIYICGVTLVSECESRAARRVDLLVGLVVVLIAVCAAPLRLFTSHWLVALLERHALFLALVGLLWGLALWLLWVRACFAPALQAVREASYAAVGPLTGRLLGAMLLFDMALVVTAHPVWVLALVPLWGAMVLLGRIARID